MSKTRLLILVLTVCALLTACSGPAADVPGADYGRIKSDFSGMTPEIAQAYLAVVDDIAAHIGYDGSDSAESEYLHGGFVRDWDGDGTPELCLLLRTSPRDPDGWEGSPVNGWYAPTLYLYTYQNGQAVRAEECDLYFGTAGRESAIAALMDGKGMRYVWWDQTLGMESYLDCIELKNGEMRITEVPDDAADAAQEAGSAQEFLDALGADKAQLLLYNNSGETKIEGSANARELRAALAAKAS